MRFPSAFVNSSVFQCAFDVHFHCTREISPSAFRSAKKENLFGSDGSPKKASTLSADLLSVVQRRRRNVARCVNFLRLVVMDP